MKKISILIPIHDNPIVTQLAITDAIANCGFDDFELLLYDNGSSDENVSSWVDTYANKTPGTKAYKSEVVKRNSEVLNFLISQANGEYICIIPFPVFLAKNWLFELLNANLTICNSGISAIREDDKNSILTNKINTSDEFDLVYQRHDNCVQGVFLFNASIITKIGGFHINLHQGYEYAHFSYRVGRLGLYNYYIIGYRACNDNLMPCSYFETKSEDYQKEISRMVEEKDFTYKISEISINSQLAKQNVKELMNKFKSIYKAEFYMEFSETWGFEIIGFSQDEVPLLVDFCQKYNVEFIVLPGHNRQDSIRILFYDK